MNGDNIKPFIGIALCRIIVILSLIAIVLCVSGYIFETPENTGTFYRDYTFDKNTVSENFLELYINSYKSNLLSLNTNIFLQIVLNLIAFRMMYSNEDNMTIPFVEISFPSNSLSILTPLALVVLWLQFGFDLFNLIIGRIAGHKIIDAIIVEHNDICLMYYLFRDGKIIDAWFHLYRDYDCVVFFEKGYISHVATKGFLSITYCILIAATNANSIIMPLLFVRTQNAYKYLSIIISILALVVIMFSHFLFYLGFKNELQYIIIFYTIAFIAVFLRRARGVPPPPGQRQLFAVSEN